MAGRRSGRVQSFSAKNEGVAASGSITQQKGCQAAQKGRVRVRSRLVLQDGGRVAVVDDERIWTDLQSLIEGTEDAVFSRRSD